LPKDIREEAVVCSTFPIETLLRVYVIDEFSLVRISDMTHKPILTTDHKEYILIDGNVAYIYKAGK
jgi:hypothetical protein